MVQVEKDLLEKAANSLETEKTICKLDGDTCTSQNDNCCNDCVGATDTTSGTCVDDYNVLFKCRWTKAGTDFALQEFQCDQWEANEYNQDVKNCPRIGDDVKRTVWMMDSYGEAAMPDRDGLLQWEKEGLVTCKAFYEKCYWTPEGAADGTVQTQLCDPAANSLCPVEAQEMTFLQADVAGFGTDIYDYRPALVQKGLIKCVSPLEAYMSWKQHPIRAKHIQCGNLPNNCFTREQAEQACKKWSEDPAVPGSGKGELCYKQELGDAVGRNCRFMWTMDSEGKEGCYEASGPDENGEIEPDEHFVSMVKYFNEFGLSVSPDTAGTGQIDKKCYPVPGHVQCITLPAIPLAAADDTNQIGFDAACCEGHFVAAGSYYQDGLLKQ